MSPHCPSDNTACTKILDWTPCRNFKQFDRMCNWFANVTTRLYSSEPVLHLCIRVQHATVAQRTNRHKIEITRSAFERLGCSKPGAARRTAEAASSSKGRAARRPYSRLDFSPPITKQGVIIMATSFASVSLPPSPKSASWCFRLLEHLDEFASLRGIS